MKWIKLNQYASRILSTFTTILFLAFKATTLQAAVLSEGDSTPSQESDWSLWLKEGNARTFIQELEKIALCVVDERVDVKHLPAKVDDMTACQQQAHTVVNYRDSAGHNVLQTYLKFSESDFIGNASSGEIIGEAASVIETLGKLGMTLVDWDTEQPGFDNLFFLAIEYDKFGLLNQLFAAIKEFDSEKLPKLPKMRSSKGLSLADAILKKKPDEMFVIAMILNYELVSDIKQVTHTTGMAYTGLRIMLMGKTEL